MANNERIDDLKEVVNNIDKRVLVLENKLSDTREEALKSERKLAELITNAVKDGNKQTAELIENIETRVCNLEKSSGEKAKYILKTIFATVITTTAGWIVLGFLNNYMTLTTSRIRENISEEAYIYENVETFV